MTTHLDDLQVNSLTVNGTAATPAVLLGSGQSVDLNGEAKGIIFDLDADTWLDGSNEDQLDLYMDSALAFSITKTAIIAKSGNEIDTNTINETTPDAGVTVDGVLIKDGATAGLRQSQILTASGAISVQKNGVVQLNHATVAIAATIAAPAAGDDLVIVDNSASGTAGHTVKLTAGTFDGTNNTATFAAPGKALHVIGLSATRYFILENIGTVALSST